MNIKTNTKLLFCLSLLAFAFNSNAKSHHEGEGHKEGGKHAHEVCSFWKGLQWGSIIDFENDTVNENHIKENALLYDYNFVFTHEPLHNELGGKDSITYKSKHEKHYVYYAFMKPEDPEALKAWNNQSSFLANRSDSEIILEPFSSADTDSISPFSFGMSYKKSHDSILVYSHRGEIEHIEANGLNGLWKMKNYNMVFMPKGTEHSHESKQLAEECLDTKYKYLDHFTSKDKGIMYIYVDENKVGDLRFYYWVENNKLYLLNKRKNYLMVLPFVITDNGQTLNFVIKETKMPKVLVKYLKKCELDKKKASKKKK